MESKKEQNNLFKHFTHYILARCWRKMCRRMTSWSSQGFSCVLGEVSESTVRESYTRFIEDTKEVSKRKDTALSAALAKQALVTEVMGCLKNQTASSESLQLTKLRAALRDSDPPVKTAYNAETCVEFHYLLVATLTGYGQALRRFSEANASGNSGNPKLQESARLLWRFAYLLWRIAYSRILRYHLAALEAGDAIYVPLNTISLKKHYLKYVQMTGMAMKLERGKKKWDPDEEVDPGDEIDPEEEVQDR